MEPIVGFTRRPGNVRRLVACLLAALFPALGASAQPRPPAVAPESFQPPPILPLDEVEAGMRGIGWSVFRGTGIDSFGVEILGVQRGSGPRSSLILFRGEGPVLEESGIIAGMSGSPVLIEGRLVGAAAFAYPFAKEPIGGITPIEEMLSILELPQETALSSSLEDGLRREEDGGPGSLQSWLESCRDPAAWARSLLAEVPGILSASASGPIEPIRTPVAVGGGSVPAGGLLDPLFEGAGWVRADETFSLAAGELSARAAVAPQTGAEAAGEEAPLRPGSAVGVRIIGGDANLTAIGTVTYRDGDRILAFGHPMFFAGGLPMPLVDARIHGVLPTRNVSLKLGSGGRIIGTMVQDQRTGISGILGPGPLTLPFHVSLTTPEGKRLEYAFDLVRHQLLTPLLVAWATNNSFTSTLAQGEPGTVRSRVRVDLEDGRTLDFQDVPSSRQPGGTLGLLATQLATYFLSSTFAPFPVLSMSVEAQLQRGLDMIYVERVEADRARVRPGETVSLRVLLRRHEGTSEWRTFDVPIPPQAAGDRVAILATSLQEFLMWDQERAPDKYAPRDLDHLFSLLDGLPSQEELMIKVYSPSAGAVIQGRELGSLPGSVLRILEGRASSGGMVPVSGLLVGEQRVAMGVQVLGGGAVVLDLDRKGGS
jgi:hypothetical protein